MAVKKIPTLTPKGFVTSITDKTDTAMLNFYLSQYSQTNMYRGARRPLPYLVQQFGQDAKAFSDALDIELTTYLGRLFENAEVEVDYTEDGKSINLRLDVIIRDNGREYSLGHEIQTANSKVIDIIDINNTGSFIRNRPALLTS